jgi:hypothetical protein
MTTNAECELLTGIIPNLLYKRTIDKSIISDIQVYQRADKLRIELFVSNIDPFHKKMRITTINMMFEDAKIEIRKYLGLEPDEYELMIGFKSNVLLFVK